MDTGAGGEGTSAVAVKRGLSVDAAAPGQDVKRFRAATGAASAVRNIICQSQTTICCVTMLHIKPSYIISGPV